MKIPLWHFMQTWPSLVLALVCDRFLPEPPNRLHLVAWMGSAIAVAQRHAPRQGRLWHFFYGAFVVLAGATLSAAAGWAISALGRRLPVPWRWLLQAVALNFVFALQGLSRAAGEVHGALDKNDLPEARRLLSWHLVSRDTATLSPSEVAAATIESVAENTSDSVVAPLLFYAAGGLPAAFAYRFVNTTDAMLGYRDIAREWLGKAPARLDDLLNLLPARLTALLLVAAAKVGTIDNDQAAAGQAWRIWRRDHNLTASPNAGHPMSAMSGALAVRLEKKGHYALGADLPPPQAAHIPQAVRLMQAAALLLVGTLTAVAFIISRRQP